MSRSFDVAVLGATGLVGQHMIEILEQRGFPVNKLYPLASSRSAGGTVTFKGEEVTVLDADTFDWSLVQLGFFSAGGSVSEKFAPIAAEAGCVVIDNTSHYRYEPDIPLVVPEVNAHALADFRNRNIIANPNCSTIQMMVALKPIHDAVGIDRINVSTYQSVSGGGKESMDELAKQTAALLNGQEAKPEAFSRQIAFNVIPQIDVFLDNDYTKEEMKMVWETQKILGDESIRVNATAVRVPVFYGHGEAIHIETRTPIDAQDAKNLLAQAPGIVLKADPADFPTQVGDASGNDDVFVGRVRNDISHPNGLNMWVVSDNVRKGAATNSIQIAEVLIRDYM
ncbi:aspartate-semialdehyde dehydrogenase [Paraglaciecola chathamensis]|jgi:aspartate-semialdehyde dehydrogenase|uniref:Aspartate-semialdehyde dehydrogenase n=3 Tax=Paraglaciecola chathamensis TaxID=368405 RepID=A0A8H9IAZ6_9ALTE|nr:MULTISPECIES: aspartate-semialdehyde dehydrogenase [Paraglaciecola]AEE21948.1 aspartate-semialdehyde dehydrogenase [Glaciecola sp. 4H-3-7+YE-5]MBN25870.1 aspartate-semialdehyde dehydrogenase [Alteromonadaceae bacterium]MBJ2138007.1 aspartate-semialdehyde dehydrogenase [Paraglaciecola chathamensis]MBU3018584.1 aspartate-semialdehyde dehydrogenase [Paraglaciecola agarilytica]MDO6558987.1 aspartate-semialdehyde dehydrogenase [Paraglaciecola chathamensis]|tara:strand:+ start:20971 stop:21987 length:1017 start_codon:yes stop_codon:yes gene_type:complete